MTMSINIQRLSSAGSDSGRVVRHVRASARLVCFAYIVATNALLAALLDMRGVRTYVRECVRGFVCEFNSVGYRLLLIIPLN